ncbi:MAG: mechanosensitive ion channel family protein, partial [Cellulomonas sp.]|nr:mechanosensitive ion channel family protein [Cellulomonas sp.]
QGWATATVEIDVDYFQDLDQVRSLLQQAAAQVVADPHVRDWVEGEPSVRGIERLSADAVTLQLTVRTAPARQWEVARRLRRAARDVLQRNDVPLGGQRDAMAARLAARNAATGPGATDPAGDAGNPSAAADRQPSPAGADADATARDPHRTPVEEAVEPHPTGSTSDAAQQPPEGPTR